MIRRVIWSPCEIEYLQANHNKLPINQLCISLAKSKNAILKKLQELELLDGKLPVQKSKGGVKSRIGKRPDCDNKFMRSSWEANTFRLLRHIKENKLTNPYPVMVEYEPVDFTFWQFGIKKGTVSYTPDFRITWSDGSTNWVEIKGGFMKPQDKTKIKRFAKYYPEEYKKLVAVPPGPTSKTTLWFESEGIPVLWYYPEINKKWKKIIAGWE